MSAIAGFRRRDGSVGVRNHLFVAPAVVCANQVAIDAAAQVPGLKHVEHQHGCAQVGVDNLQAQAVFSALAQHPNVSASMLVGLGCEGIMADHVYDLARARGRAPVELTVIQEAGGTLGAEAAVKRWAAARSAAAQAEVRAPARAAVLRIGGMADPDAETSAALPALLRALRDAGYRLIVPLALAPALRRSGGEPREVRYGEEADAAALAMRGGETPLEVATGLAAAGAVLVLHVAARVHAFGLPVVPLLRVAATEPLQAAAGGDLDGSLTAPAAVPAVLDALVQAINGRPTVAEELELDDFALYRIGPTV